MMIMSNATEYKNKYIAEKYDRINLTVPKGVKERITVRAKELGISTNGYLQALIQNDLEGKSIPLTADTTANSKKDMDVFLL